MLYKFLTGFLLSILAVFAFATANITIDNQDCSYQHLFEKTGKTKFFIEPRTGGRSGIGCTTPKQTIEIESGKQISVPVEGYTKEIATETELFRCFYAVYAEGASAVGEAHVLVKDGESKTTQCSRNKFNVCICDVAK